MYLEHFGLHEPPFRITPHTDFFFDGADRGTTLDALVYAVLHDEGIVKVSGEVGSGKTMLCRVLLERLPDTVETVYLANPSLTRDELLHSIADELQITLSTDASRVVMRELFEHLIRLYAQGRRVVILIDEAHAMPDETLEQVRLLSNLESSRHKLLQMVLFGQPELDEALAKPSMRQLKDRITHSFRMRPLTETEVSTYVSFRMRAAGYRGPDVFSRRAVAMIAAASNGLSRRINILADKALLAAFAEGRHAVAEREVRAAIRDSEFAALSPPGRRSPYLIGATLLAAGLAVGFVLERALLPETNAPAMAVSSRAPAAAPAPTPAAVPATAPEPPPAPPAPPAAAAPAPTPSAPPAAAEAPKVEPVAEAATTAPAAEAPPAAPPPAAPPELSPAQRRHMAAYPAAQKLLRGRVAAARKLLETEADANYSIELFTTDNWDPARMERFLIRARDLVPLDEVYVVPMRGPRTYRIRVVYGAYSTKEAAAEARDRLPPKYQKAFQMELRSFSDLRADL
ncbi:MAG: ExeA family protein [Burkholderiales bacterium]